MKKILICALLITGCSGKQDVGALECRGLDGTELWHIDAQVAQKEESTLPEYFFGKPEDSVRSLVGLIDIYRRAQCTALVSQVAKESFQYKELLALGRLARLYERLGNKTQSDAEATNAVALGRIVLRQPSWSTADLIKLVDEVDAKQRAYLAEIQASPSSKQ